MNSEPQFLSFKGLKQYTPEDGWGQVNQILQSHTQQPPDPVPPTTHRQAHTQAHTPSPQAPRYQAVPDNVPTLTETPDAPEVNASPMFDPLIHELFEQLLSLIHISEPTRH